MSDDTLNGLMSLALVLLCLSIIIVYVALLSHIHDLQQLVIHDIQQLVLTNQQWISTFASEFEVVMDPNTSFEVEAVESFSTENPIVTLTQNSDGFD